MYIVEVSHRHQLTEWIYHTLCHDSEISNVLDYCVDHYFGVRFRPVCPI